MGISPEIISHAVAQMLDGKVSELGREGTPHKIGSATLRSDVGAVAKVAQRLCNGAVRRTSNILRASEPEIGSVLDDDSMKAHEPYRPRILVVEDEPSVLSYIGTALSMKPYMVVSCEDAEIALEELERDQFDVVLTDCRLPGMQGDVLTSTIGAHYPEVPVIGMSGEHYKGAWMLDAGAVTFIEKPLELTLLWLEVERALAG